MDFLKPFGNHKLLKFIRLNRKFNPDHVKSFYCNLKVSSTCLECNFCNKVSKFTLDDFKYYLGLESKENDACISNLIDFVRENFVKFISKSVYKDFLGMENFHISQVKFEMRIIHWIVMKIIYWKPHNSERDGDLDLNLMWILMKIDQYN